MEADIIKNKTIDTRKDYLNKNEEKRVLELKIEQNSLYNLENTRKMNMEWEEKNMNRKNK